MSCFWSCIGSERDPTVLRGCCVRGGRQPPPCIEPALDPLRALHSQDAHANDQTHVCVLCSSVLVSAIASLTAATKLHAPTSFPRSALCKVHENAYAVRHSSHYWYAVLGMECSCAMMPAQWNRATHHHTQTTCVRSFPECAQLKLWA